MSLDRDQCYAAAIDHSRYRLGYADPVMLDAVEFDQAVMVLLAVCRDPGSFKYALIVHRGSGLIEADVPDYKFYEVKREVSVGQRYRT